MEAARVVLGQRAVSWMELRRMELQILIVAAVMAAVLAMVVLGVNVRTRAKEDESLRELGFTAQDPPPASLAEALRHLSADKDAKTEVRVTRCLRLRGRAADVYFADFQAAESDKSSYRQVTRSLHAINPKWNLAPVTVLTLKAPEGLGDRMIAQTLDTILGKHLRKIDISGLGDFSQRARVFAEDEHAARRLLTSPVRKTLLALPYGLFEANGPAFCLGRPAQAGPGKWTQQDWRQLTDTVRALAEEISSSPAAHG
jgi:hypothetical protein